MIALVHGDDYDQSTRYSYGSIKARLVSNRKRKLAYEEKMDKMVILEKVVLSDGDLLLVKMFVLIYTGGLTHATVSALPFILYSLISTLYNR